MKFFFGVRSNSKIEGISGTFAPTPQGMRKTDNDHLRKAPIPPHSIFQELSSNRKQENHIQDQHVNHVALTIPTSLETELDNVMRKAGLADDDKENFFDEIELGETIDADCDHEIVSDRQRSDRNYLLVAILLVVAVATVFGSAFGTMLQQNK